MHRLIVYLRSTAKDHGMTTSFYEKVLSLPKVSGNIVIYKFEAFLGFLPDIFTTFFRNGRLFICVVVRVSCF